MGYERRPRRRYQSSETRDFDRNLRNHRPDDYNYDERDFFSRSADEVMSWFGNDEAEARRKFDALMDRRFGSDYMSRRYSGMSASRDTFDPAPRNRTVGTNMNFGMDQRDEATGFRDNRDRFAEDYAIWRDRQIDNYDRDYLEFQRERQDKFDREFSEWRQKRYEQRLAVGTVKEDQEVVGSDGKHVGTVDYIRGERVILTKNDKDSGGHHHSIPSNWIERVDKKVILNRTAEDAQNKWRDIEARKAFFESDYESEDPSISERAYARTLHD